MRPEVKSWYGLQLALHQSDIMSQHRMREAVISAAYRTAFAVQESVVVVDVPV